MGRVSGNKWLGIVVAVLVVAGLGLYAASQGSHPVSQQAAATAAATPANGSFAPYNSDPLAAANNSGSQSQPVPGMSAGTLVGLVFKVGIVALLLGVCLWLLRRYAGTSSRNGGRTGAVAIVDTIPLAQGRAMYVLDIGDRAILVGVTPQQFSFLADVTDDTVLTKLRTGPARGTLPVSGLSHQFGGMMQRFSAARQAATAHATAHGFEGDEGNTVEPRPRSRQAAGFADALAEYQANVPAPSPAPTGVSTEAMTRRAPVASAELLRPVRPAPPAATPDVSPPVLTTAAVAAPRPARPAVPVQANRRDAQPTNAAPADNTERLRALAERLRAPQASIE